jgi:hypothetical protein
MDVQNFDPINTVLDDKFFQIEYFNPSYLFEKGYNFFHTVLPYFFRGENLDGLKLILSLFALFFIIIITYTTVRMLEIRKKEHAHLKEEIAEYAHHQAERERKIKESNQYKNNRWAKVLAHVFSPTLSDWKLAIIEADSMLEDLLTQLNFKGENIGEKLKSADREKFKNLTAAWEVHTIRNKIAHEGLNFEISQKEAKRVIALYEQIFREFGFI